MHLQLTDEQRQFRETTQKFLQAETPIPVVRELYDDPRGFDRGWWRSAADLGWAGLFVPEAQGGGSLSGSPAADAVVVAECLGRAVAPGPFLPVSVSAAAIAWSGAAEHAALLSALASGDSICTWALGEPGDVWPLGGGTAVSAHTDGDDVVLDGVKAYVEAVDAADHVLVTASGADGPVQVVVPVDAPGVTVRPGRSVDVTRRFGSVSLTGVRVSADAVLGGGPVPAATLHRQVALAVALQCAGLVGVVDQTVQTTIAYGRDRIAFGRPIVSFQVLKHRLADMLVALEGMKAVTVRLAAAVDGDEPGTARLASVAKAHVGRHAVDLVDACVQIVGGMGVTWEHDIHLYSRRAVVDRAVYGSPEQHLRHVAVALAEEARR